MKLRYPAVFVAAIIFWEDSGILLLGNKFIQLIASILGGIQTAFWLWFGFVVTTHVPTVIFEGRNFGVFLINVAYQFVGCALAGVILAIWRTRDATAPASQPV